MKLGGVAMSENKKQPEKKVPLKEGHQPVKKGYQPIPGDIETAGYRPTEGNLDILNPPKGGSGVPLKSSNNSEKSNKLDGQAK